MFCCSCRKTSTRWTAILIAICVASFALWRRSNTDQNSEFLWPSPGADKPGDWQDTAVTTSDSTAFNEGHALDSVLTLAKQALERFNSDVMDYSARIVRRERISGRLGVETVIEAKIRNGRSDLDPPQPLSAYLKFLEPSSVRGREVIWVRGRNDGKLSAHEGGFKNFLTLELDPDGMTAMMGNKYPITEIGIARLLEKLIEKGNRDREVGPCKVRTTEDQKIGDVNCRLIEVLHPDKRPEFDFHLAQIFIDMDRLVPLRYAAYLWPENEGEPPILEEEYTYLDLKLNVGLQEDDFDAANAAYNFP
ncbi:MAG: DUF1571 domain-containing protein [Planctomycetales bacterium]|nr:DUF1571 domain-containing protein [Planctomycetales bacterium]